MRFEHMDHQTTSHPYSTRTLDVQGKRLKLDAEGHLLDAIAWTPLVAETLAKKDRCIHTSEQWLLIGHLRRYYDEYQIAPDLPLLTRYLRKKQDKSRWTRDHIKTLFPGGAKTACRYTGLPAPVGRCCLC